MLQAPSESRRSSTPLLSVLLKVESRGLVPPAARGSLAENGMILLAVLVVGIAVAGSAALFIPLMNGLQARAGVYYRSVAALALAEAGIHSGLGLLESVAQDGWPASGRLPAAYSERLSSGYFEGRFTLSMTDSPDGSIIITSTGEVSGTNRQVRARVYLASSALLSSLYATGFIQLGKGTILFIHPYAGVGDRQWFHVATGAGVRLAGTGVSINDPSVPFHTLPGPVDALGQTSVNAASPELPPVRVLLARGAKLIVGRGREPLMLDSLGTPVKGIVLRAESLPLPPEVNRAFYRVLAAANRNNADLNAAVGEHFLDRELSHKRDSLYSERQFELLLDYLAYGQRPSRLTGVIYVAGDAAFPDNGDLHLADGALIVEDSIHLNPGSSVEITHSVASRALPGIMALDGELVVDVQAELRVHGLVYAAQLIEIAAGARADVVGSVLGVDRGISFSIAGATVIIRYDPAVLGTPGLRAPRGSRATAWIAAWEELPWSTGANGR